MASNTVFWIMLSVIVTAMTALYLPGLWAAWRDIRRDERLAVARQAFADRYRRH